MAARKQPPPEIRLAEAALRLLAKTPWQELTLAGVARTAKIPLTELRLHAPTRASLFGLVLRRLSDAATKRYRPEDGTARDRLFDVGMAWFDGLARHKPALRALYAGVKSDPLLLIAARDEIAGIAEWLMVLAEADKGAMLSARSVAFAAILARALPVWLDDDKDLTKTMARLDADLRRAGNLFARR